MLESSNNMQRLGTFFLFVLLFAVSLGCRKEILHEPGVTFNDNQTEEDVVFDPSEDPVGKSWKLVNEPIGQLYSLEVYNDQLFLGGGFWLPSRDVNKIAIYDGGQYKPALPDGDFIGAGRISDLKTYEGQLYIGGSFEYEDFSSQQTHHHLMRLQNNELSGFGILENTFTFPSKFTTYQNFLICLGRFQEEDPNVFKTHIKRIQGNSLVDFTPGLTEIVNDGFEFENEFYVTGSSDYYPGFDVIVKQTGSDWEGQDLNEAINSSSNGQSMAEYQGELYVSATAYRNLTGNIQSGIFRKTGDKEWKQELRPYWTGFAITNLYVIGDFLYFVGENIHIGNSNQSNVIRYDGNSWEFVGRMKHEVSDLQLYNGRIYAATGNGLYKLL